MYFYNMSGRVVSDIYLWKKKVHDWRKRSRKTHGTTQNGP